MYYVVFRDGETEMTKRFDGYGHRNKVIPDATDWIEQENLLNRTNFRFEHIWCVR